MYLKYVPLAKIRAAAAGSIASWRNAEERLANADLPGAVKSMERTEAALKAADVQAVVVLISIVRKCVENGSTGHAVQLAVEAVRDEIAMLAASDVRPTLRLFDIAKSVLAQRQLEAAPLQIGDFFLPAMPSASFGDDQGQFADAARKYSGPLRQAIIAHTSSPSKDTAKNLRSVLVALANRSMRGAPGLMASMSVALLDGAMDSQWRVHSDDMGCLLQVSMAYKAMSASGAVEIEGGLLSRMAYKISTSQAPRAQDISKRLGLSELHVASKAIELPQAATFGRSWQDTVDAWEAYVTSNASKPHGSSFIKHLNGLIQASYPSKDLARMSENLLKFLEVVSAGGISGNQSALNAFVSERLALINDAYTTGDPIHIAAESSESTRTLQQCITDRRLPNGSAMQTALPIREVMIEVGAEITTSIDVLERGDAAKAGQVLASSLMSLSILVGLVPNVQSLIDAGLAVSGVLTKVNRDVAEVCLKELRQALEVFARDQKSAEFLTNEIRRRIQDAMTTQPQRGNAHTDFMGDAEIFEIFFEEAKEVCNGIGDVADRCERVGHIDMESAELMRRGFHTLKGSSRMAGLSHVGECAWLVEQAMNHCLATRQMPTEYVHIAPRAAEWIWLHCENIKRDGSSEIDSTDFENLLSGKIAPQDEIAHPEFQCTQVFEDDDQSKQRPSSTTVLSTLMDVDYLASDVGGISPASGAGAEFGHVPKDEPLEVDLIALDFHEEVDSDSRPAVVDVVELAAGLMESVDRPEQVGAHDPEVLAAFAKESREMTAMARVHLSNLATTGVTSELVRAAHSLAGMARIVSMHELEVLARGLEHWATASYGSGCAPSADGVHAAFAVFREIDRIVEASGRDAVYLANLGLAEELRKFGSDDEGAEATHVLGTNDFGITVIGGVDELADSAVEQEESDPLANVDLNFDFLSSSANEGAATDPSFVQERECPGEQQIELASECKNATESVDAEQERVAEAEVTHDADAGTESKVTDLQPFFQDSVRSPDAEDPQLLAMPDIPLTDAVDAGDAQQPPKLPEIAVARIELASHIEASDENAGFIVPDDVLDDIDSELLIGYMPEAEETLAALDVEIAGFDPVVASFREINRLLHTLKGGARMVGMIRLGAMIHQMENVTMATGTLSERDAIKLIGRIQRACDSIRNQLVAVTNPSEPNQEQPAKADSAVHDDPIIRVQSSKLESVSELITQLRIGQDRIRRRVAAGLNSTDSLELPVHRLLDVAQRIAAEAEARMESGVKQNDAFDALEFDRFTKLHEYTRRLQEAASDIEQLFSTTASALLDIRDSVRMQDELSERALSSLDSLGRTGIASFDARLRSVVRQAGDVTGKPCQIEIDGDVRIERSTLERLMPVMEHILRNAVAHGIEAADTRRAIGKQATGMIRVSSKRDGAYALVTVSDDGAGVDVDRVQQKAIGLGILKGSDKCGEEEVLEALFAPGFSTAATVTDISGRGVGLDVVRGTVNKLGGAVSIQTERGRGTSFTLRIPVSASFVSGLLLRVGNSPYILPSSMVRGVEMVSASEMRSAISTGAGLRLENGSVVSLKLLGDLCGIASNPEIRAFNPVVIPAGLEQYGVFADSLEFVNGVPIKPLPNGVTVGRGTIAHSVLSDGRVAPVLNLNEVLKGQISLGHESRSSVVKVVNLAPLVMVVDDSVTVRTVTKKLLIKNGFRVATAEDGAVAIEYLSSGAELPGVILMDIEMPNMDGFEATRIIKGSERLRHIPLTIISSRNAEKHITHARELGADNFFGKPYKDTELLGWIGDSLENAAA